MKLKAEEQVEQDYEAAGNLKRAQVDYVRSVASSLRVVIARLGDGPQASCAMQSLDATVLWASMAILDEQKTEAA